MNEEGYYNILTIKSLPTIKNEEDEIKSLKEEEKTNIKNNENIFLFNNENNITLNLIPKRNNTKIISPFASYYSKKIPSKKRNKSLNLYKIKIINNRKNTFSKEEISNENLDKLKESFSISKVSFDIISNKEKENVNYFSHENLIQDLSFSNNNFQNEKYENYNYDIPIKTLDNENKENLIFDFHFNKTINCLFNEIETDYSQNKSNSNLDFNKNKFNEKKLNQKIQIYPFKKIQFKNKIKLPDFSWVVNKENIQSNKCINNKNKNNNNKRKKKLIIKRNKNSIKKENENNYNIKFIDSQELHNIHRKNDFNQIKNKSRNFFHQSDIYNKLTHYKK